MQKGERTWLGRAHCRSALLRNPNIAPNHVIRADDLARVMVDVALCGQRSTEARFSRTVRSEPWPRCFNIYGSSAIILCSGFGAGPTGSWGIGLNSVSSFRNHRFSDRWKSMERLWATRNTQARRFSSAPRCTKCRSRRRKTSWITSSERSRPTHHRTVRPPAPLSHSRESPRHAWKSW
jgi:hypothetical protein